MIESVRARYLCGPGLLGGGAAGATSLGGVSPSEGGPALLLLGLFAAAGWWMFRRFGGRAGPAPGSTAEAEAGSLVTTPIPESEQLDDDEREPVLS